MFLTNLLTDPLCVSVYAVQRRAIVTVLDAHRQDLDTTSLTSGLKGMGILTEEQYQKLASLDDERRHEALLYTLLAHDGPDTYDKLVECMELRDTSIAADLQGVLVYSSFRLQNLRLFIIHNILHVFCAATLEDVKESPGALSVIGSFKGTLLSHYQKDIMLPQVVSGLYARGNNYLTSTSYIHCPMIQYWNICYHGSIQ